MDQEPPDEFEPPPDDGPRPLDADAKVLVFRNHNGAPIAVPEQVVVEGERLYRAYTLNREGRGWREVAQIEGFPSGGAAAAAVKRYIDEGAALVSEQSKLTALEMEMDRLNVLQTFLWDKAKEGNIGAVAEIRQIIKTRVEILTGSMAEENDISRTVVIPAEPGSYTMMLQRVVSDAEKNLVGKIPGPATTDE